jgi:hypothetical protein
MKTEASPAAKRFLTAIYNKRDDPDFPVSWRTINEVEDNLWAYWCDEYNQNVITPSGRQQIGKR